MASIPTPEEPSIDPNPPRPRTEPLRIALIRASYTDFGGAEQFVARAVQALAGSNVRVTLLTRRWDHNGQADVLTCDPFYVGRLWRDWGFGRAVCRTLRDNDFDLVQSHERVPCCDVYRAGDGVHVEWLRQRRRQMGCWGRLALALNPYHWFVASVERRLFASPRLRAVICNSEMVKAEILERFDVAETKLHVIYSGVDTEQFHPRLREAHRLSIRREYAIPADAILFLFVGSGFERKGLRQLLQATALLPSNCHLMVVGKDRKTGRFERFADSLGISGRVRFTGPLKDVTGAYGAADAFVLPTLYDPVPNVILEAMACGLPVITSTKSGGAEFIEPGTNGYVCDALDVSGLCRSMQHLLSEDARELMGEACRRKVEPYTLERMSECYIRLYRSLLEEAER